MEGDEDFPLSLSFTMVCCFQGHGQRWVVDVGGPGDKKKRVGECWGSWGERGEGWNRSEKTDEMKYLKEQNENI